MYFFFYALQYVPVAQGIERWSPEPEVASSNLARHARIIHYKIDFEKILLSERKYIKKRKQLSFLFFMFTIADQSE